MRSAVLVSGAALAILSGCWAPGIGPRAKLRPLTRAVLAADGYYRLTPSDKKRIEQTSCRFDPAGKSAERLYRRGFSKAEILQACRDVHRYAHGDQRYLEHLAVWRRAGLPFASFGDFQSREVSITDYYNRWHIGGAGLAAAGWILTGLGTALWTGALATVVAYRVRLNRCNASLPSDADLPCDHDGADGMATFIFSALQGVLGTALVAPGLPMAIVGSGRMRSWVSGQLLDAGHVDDLDRFRLHYMIRPKRPRVRASVAPLLTRGGAGLSLTLRW